MSKTKKFYMNAAQQYVWQIAPRNLTVIASRRFGKSEGIIMPTLLRNIQAMPRSSGAIVGQTYKQVLTRTLPATLHALDRLGYHEREHYYVGRQAPKGSGFKDPYIKPRSASAWDYYIHWYNGSVNPIISQDIPFSSNSLTLDYWIADEVKTLNREKLLNETIPANSGLVYFKDCPWHTGYTMVSDMPTNKRGLWMLEEESKMDKELLCLIEAIIYSIYEAKSLGSESVWYQNKIKALTNELNLYRKELSLFVVFDILDNLEIVGERYIEDMYRNLPKFIFMTALLSQRMKNTEGGFYAALNDKIHYYQSYDNSYLNSFRTGYGDIDWKSATEHVYDCSQDTDINVDRPLCIAFDTNININWCIVGQPDYEKNKLRTLKSFFVKHPRMLTELCNEFADYYEPLPNKEVIFYYDSTFTQGKSGNSTEAFFETIIRVLTNRGWYVTDTYIGQPMKHNEKHKEIDDALKGSRNLFPLFNQPNNEILLQGMEQTGTSVGLNGWGKDKSGEKKPDTPEDPAEFRTDGGDAWDTLFIGCNNYRVDEIYSRISLPNVYK